MGGSTLIIWLGLVNWLTVTIIVESEIFRPIREFVDNQQNASIDRQIKDPAWLDQFTPGDTTPEHVVDVMQRTVHGSKVWREAHYFVSCHLCVGVWVGIVEVAFAGPQVLHGVAGYVAGALAFKAVGHLALEAVAVLKKAGKQ